MEGNDIKKRNAQQGLYVDKRQDFKIQFYLNDFFHILLRDTSLTKIHLDPPPNPRLPLECLQGHLQIMHNKSQIKVLDLKFVC